MRLVQFHFSRIRILNSVWDHTSRLCINVFMFESLTIADQRTYCQCCVPLYEIKTAKASTASRYTRHCSFCTRMKGCTAYNIRLPEIAWHILEPIPNITDSSVVDQTQQHVVSHNCHTCCQQSLVNVRLTQRRKIRFYHYCDVP